MTQDSTASTSISNAFSSPLSFTPSTSQPATPKPNQQAQSQPQPQPQPAQQAQPASDPFAVFKTSTPKPAAASAAAQPSEDDEWNFSSSLPAETSNKPKEQRTTITDGSIRGEFLANRSPPSSNAINMAFSFSNNTAQPVSEFHFQLAVTKVSPPFFVLNQTFCLVTNHKTHDTGLRTPTPTANRPRPLPEAKQGHNAAGSRVARRQPRATSRRVQAPLARGVQGGRRAKGGDGGDCRV